MLNQDSFLVTAQPGWYADKGDDTFVPVIAFAIHPTGGKHNIVDGLTMEGYMTSAYGWSIIHESLLPRNAEVILSFA